MKYSKLTTGLFLLTAFILPLLFISCDGNSDSEPDDLKLIYHPAGEIPGLGECEGKLTGKVFTLPDGIILDRDIKGTYDRLDSKEPVESNTGYDIANADIILGATSKNRVSLFISLKNETSRDIAVTFPAGLIIESETGYFQNGLLLKKSTATIPANSAYNIVMLLYCGNMVRDISTYNEIYNFAVVSNSVAIDDLCKRFANKKINYEEYSPTMPNMYADICSRIQDIVWQITDSGIGISSSDAKWINELPSN